MGKETTTTQATRQRATKKTKELEVVIAAGSGLYKIQYKGGGQLPAMLTGKYTDRQTAETDIKVYQETVKG